MEHILVFDLNEVLCIRKWDPSAVLYQELIQKHPGVVWSINGFCVVLRPGVQEFLKKLSEKFRIVIWSSAQRKNILPIIQCCFSDIPIDVFDQSHCTPIPRENSHPLFKKNLRVISKHYGVPIESVTIIDNTKEKIVNQERYIQVSSFTDPDKGKNELDVLAIFLLEGKSTTVCNQVIRLLNN